MSAVTVLLMGVVKRPTAGQWKVFYSLAIMTPLNICFSESTTSVSSSSICWRKVFAIISIEAMIKGVSALISPFNVDVNLLP